MSTTDPRPDGPADETTGPDAAAGTGTTEATEPVVDAGTEDGSTVADRVTEAARLRDEEDVTETQAIDVDETQVLPAEGDADAAATTEALEVRETRVLEAGATPQDDVPQEDAAAVATPSAADERDPLDLFGARPADEPTPVFSAASPQGTTAPGAPGAQPYGASPGGQAAGAGAAAESHASQPYGAAPAAAHSAPAAPAAAVDDAPRGVRVGTVVWGLVVAAVGVGLVAWASGVVFDVELALIGLVAAAGVALLVGSLVAPRRRRR